MRPIVIVLGLLTVTAAMPALAAGRTSNSVGTGVVVEQDSGLSFGDNERVNGSIVTGNNRSRVGVNQRVRSRAATAPGLDQREAVMNRHEISQSKESRMEALKKTGVMIGSDGRINSNIVTDDNDASVAVDTQH